MKTSLVFLAAFFLNVACVGCGVPQNNCNITAISEHLAVPPDNKVQFATISSVSGNCPLAPDTLGTWSTSASGNTSIASTGLATCLGATTTLATISYSGTVHGRGFKSAALTCR